MEEKVLEELMATIAQFQRDVEKTFEKIWTKLATERPLKLGAWEPPADVIDKDNEIIIYVDVPGYSKDDVKVRVTDDTIEVMAERKVEAATEGKYILKQRVREVLYKRIDL
ncbi:MAG: Hsp20/alpha crystallin family protein, partial [Thermofilaceae archaeon]